jgi:hypothetical protein
LQKKRKQQINEEAKQFYDEYQAGISDNTSRLPAELQFLFRNNDLQDVLKFPLYEDKFVDIG